MPLSISFLGEKVSVQQNFQTQQLLSGLILGGQHSKSNFSAEFSNIMKNIVESADLSMGLKIKEVQTECRIEAKGHQIIENLKKLIMSKGISLDKLIVDDKGLTALSNFLVDTGFDKEEIISRIEACKTINNKSELRLSDLFASFSQLKDPESEKQEKPLIEISALPHIESILYRLKMEPERINNATADATIEGKGISIDLLVSNLKKIIADYPESKSLVLDQKDQNEIEEIMNSIDSEHKIVTDGSITLEGFVAGLETLFDQRSNSFQSSCLLSRDLNTFLKNIEVDQKVKDFSVIPGFVEAISEIETSDMEESKWFYFQLNKEKIESNTVKSLINPFLNEKRGSIQRAEIFNDSEEIISNSSNCQINSVEGLDEVESTYKKNLHEKLVASDWIHWISWQILDRIEKGQNEINFDLQSLGLGRLQVAIEKIDDRLKLHITTEQPQFKEMLVMQADHLKTALMKQKSSFKILEIQNHNIDSPLPDLFEKIIPSDSAQIQLLQKVTSVSETDSAMGTINKKYRRFDFEENHTEIGSKPREYIMNQLDKEAPIQGVEIIFESKEDNTKTGGNATNDLFFEINPVRDTLSGSDQEGDSKGIGIEISLDQRVEESILEPLTNGVQGGPKKKLDGKQQSVEIVDPIKNQIFRNIHKSQNQGILEPKPAISENFRLDVEKNINRNEPISIDQVPDSYDKSNNSNVGKYTFVEDVTGVSEMIKVIEETDFKEFNAVVSKVSYAGLESNSADYLKNNWIHKEQIGDVKRVLEPEKYKEYLSTQSKQVDHRVDARPAMAEIYFAMNNKNKSLATLLQPEVVEDKDFETSKMTTRIFSDNTALNLTSEVGELAFESEQKPSGQMLVMDIMDQVSGKILRSIHKGKNEINLELKPEGLGRLHLHIENDDDTLKVRILAEHQSVKEILVAHVGDLKTALMDQGLCLESCDIRTSYNFDQSLANSQQESNKSNDRRRKEINNKGSETGISLERISETFGRNKTLLDLVA